MADSDSEGRAAGAQRITQQHLEAVKESTECSVTSPPQAGRGRFRGPIHPMSDFFARSPRRSASANAAYHAIMAILGSGGGHGRE
jgi:hypothetical protein